MNLYKSLPLFLLLLCVSAVEARSVYADRFFFSGEFEKVRFISKGSVRITSNLIAPKVRSDFLNRLDSAYSINLGYRFNMLALRLGYSHSTNMLHVGDLYNADLAFVTANGTVVQKNFNIYIDSLYYFPLAKRTEFKLLLGLGGFRSKLQSKLLTPNTIGNSSENPSVFHSFRPVARYGAGLEFELNRYFSADVILKSILPGNEVYRTFIALSFGLTAHF